jgi:hypothetical protein
MKYLCLGYLDESRWAAMSKAEREAASEECLAYGELLRRNGQLLRADAVQSGREAVTVRWRGAAASVTGGPYADSIDQLCGTCVLEARDLNHAIQIMSEHPGLRLGPFEIRALDEERTP